MGARAEKPHDRGKGRGSIGIYAKRTRAKPGNLLTFVFD